MSWLAFSFGAPMVLWGLLALPVIWWLLRLTPPRPQMEVFPPLRILARVLKREETPHKSPWWLTLLRLVMAGLIVLAMADPVHNPRERMATEGEVLALVVDNGWAAAPDWEARVATADRLIADAEAASVPVLLAFTAEAGNAEIGPFSPAEARERLNAAVPRPVPVNRPAVLSRVARTLETLPSATIALLTDGLASEGDEDAFARLLQTGPAHLVWAQPDRVALIGLRGFENRADAFAVSAIRSPGETMPRQVIAAAFDERGRRLAETTLVFAPGGTEANGEMAVPFELRNDFAHVAIEGEQHAGAVQVLDENSRRRRVGLIAQTDVDRAQPLLSPLYYIRNAMAPFADLIEPSSPDLAEAVPELLEQKPAMIVMADVGTLPESARAALIEWLEAGGTLVRFAGSRLAAADNDEALLPVRLRIGERALGGTLSWAEPQPLAAFPQGGPFSDLPPPQDVTVSRQVLAEPTPDIVERTWAELADGTPLVTGAARGRGTLALFHVTPEATWSSLPISGTFVEMLRRLVLLSRNAGAAAANGPLAEAALPPFRMISADGSLVPPPPEARPLDLGSGAPVLSVENPPGLYGGEEGVVAVNLLRPDAEFRPVILPETGVPVVRTGYSLGDQTELKGALLAAALALMILDTLAVFFMSGLFARRRFRTGPGAAAGSAAALLLAMAIGFSMSQAHAQSVSPEVQVSDAEAIDAISRTRIAYVLTGDSQTDAVSRAGLVGLTRFLTEKTALEPGPPAGVDIERDELVFYPLIYWPVEPDAPMPSEAALARVDAYMKQGGTILFDTRDQYASDFTAASASPATRRLRDILDTMNVPPLEPVPEDHVLTKAFYILNDFPGRYSGSPLWVEASPDATRSSDRPVRTGDGVTPIMITGNDFAGAWAVSESGEPLLPTVPADPTQRVLAYRAGVNIMMYMLTGNYKSDQVHVPVLLERLGQ